MEIDKIILREEEEMTRRKKQEAVFGVLLAGVRRGRIKPKRNKEAVRW